MDTRLALTECELIDRLSIWIKSFSWNENDERTDAVMEFTVIGITDWHLETIVDVNSINDKVLKQVVTNKASQFADVNSIMEMSWKVVNVTDAIGRRAKAIHVYAYLRLAEDCPPFN